MRLQQNWKKIVSLLLIAVMIVGILPGNLRLVEASVVADETVQISDNDYSYDGYGTSNGGFYITTTPDSLAYDSVGWSTRYVAVEGGIYFNGVKKANVQLIKTAECNYYVDLGPNGIYANEGDTVTISGVFGTESHYVRFEAATFKYFGSNVWRKVEVTDVTVAKITDETGNKPYFPDIINIPASVYTDGSAPNGKLLVTYYKNTAHAMFTESDGPGTIQVVESLDNGVTWSEPRDVVTPENLRTTYGLGTEEHPAEGRDPNLTLMNDGTILLTFYVRYKGGNAYSGDDTKTYILESTDGGTTWSDKLVEIPCNDANGVPTIEAIAKNGDIAVLDDNSIVIPLYGPRGEYLYTNVAVSAKRTAKDTWEFGTACDIGNPATDYTDNGLVHDETALVYVGNDTLYAFARDTGYVWISTDRGVTWTHIATEQPENNKVVNQPDFELLPDGSIFVTYAIPATEYGRPVYGKLFYPELGWNATKAEMIYRSEGNQTDCGDASTVLTNDGRLLTVTYDLSTKGIEGIFTEVEDWAIPELVSDYNRIAYLNEDFEDDAVDTDYNNDFFVENGNTDGAKTAKVVLESEAANNQILRLKAEQRGASAAISASSSVGTVFSASFDIKWAAQDVTGNQYFEVNMGTGRSEMLWIEHHQVTCGGVVVAFDNPMEAETWYSMRVSRVNDTFFLKVWEKGSVESEKWTGKFNFPNGLDNAKFSIGYTDYASTRYIDIDNLLISTAFDFEIPETLRVATDETATIDVKFPTGSAPVAWSSSQEDVATVADGVVTPVSAGTTTITATANGISHTCEVTVVEMTRYELDDWGIEGRTYSNESKTGTAKEAGSLHNVSVKATYNFSSSSSILFVGAEWAGIRIDGSGEFLMMRYTNGQSGGEQKLALLHPNAIGLAKLTGEDIEIELSFYFENESGDGTTTDVVTTVKLSNPLTGQSFEQEFYYKNVAVATMQRTAFIYSANAGCPLTVYSGSIFDLDLSDFNVTWPTPWKDGTNLEKGELNGHEVVGTAGSGTLQNISIQGVYKFGKTANNCLMYIGGSWTGVRIEPSGDALLVRYHDGIYGGGWQEHEYSITAQEAGMQLTNTEIEMTTSFAFDNFNEDKTVADVTLTIVVTSPYSTNLYKESFTFTGINLVTMQKTVHLYTASGYEMSYASSFTYPEVKQLTLSDVGIAPQHTIHDGLHDPYVGSTLNGGSFINSRFTQKITFSNHNNIMFFAGLGDWHGIGFLARPDGTIYIEERESADFEETYTLEPEVAGTTLVGEEIELGIELLKDGHNVKMGVYINGKLYNNEYFMLTRPTLGTKIGYYPSAAGAAIQIGESTEAKALGATLATGEHKVKMGFDFSAKLEQIVANGETVQSYGAVLVAGTKSPEDMLAQAKKMLNESLLEDGYYKRTEQSDVDALNSANGEYHVTITNSGDPANMGIRATAIGYIKTDAGVYFTTDSVAGSYKRVNKSVMGLLKAIFADKYIPDSDENKNDILQRAIDVYNSANQADVTVDKVKEIVARAKSTEQDRAILSGVHYKLNEIALEDIVTNQFP